MQVYCHQTVGYVVCCVGVVSLKVAFIIWNDLEWKLVGKKDRREPFVWVSNLGGENLW